MVMSFLEQTGVDVFVYFMVWLIYPYTFMRITSNFHMTSYHDSIQRLLFYWYITETLSGRTWIEIRHLVNPKKTSAWIMKKRVKNGFTFNIENESEARIAANELFRNVAKPGSEFIEFEDLARFLPENDALATWSIFDKTSEGEATQISCSSLQQLMVDAFRLERSLVLSMKDTDSIISRMRIIVYLVTGTIQVLGLVGQMLDGLGYMFFFSLALFDITKSLESRLFNDSVRWFFFRQSFDVGERCLIDGAELVVKKINFFSTTFMGVNDNKEYQLCSSILYHKWPIERFDGDSRLEKIQLILSDFQGTTSV